MKILVTGGAGYIGSFMVRLLLERGYDVVIFDNLERGHVEFIPEKAVLFKGDIKNEKDLDQVFSNNKFDAVMHFAGLIAVGESEEKPDLYYQNNVVGSRNLFNKAISYGVNKFIFSSSAAVYGNPQTVPIPESHPKNPTSEYGKNKLEVETILESIRKENDSVSFACLRYFNAAGAGVDGSHGEGHIPETHIIPLAIKAALNGAEFKLFGTNYGTSDGTCVRDYIHVLDLVEAHILALEKINIEDGGYYYNVGTGKGYSNREVISAVEEISGRKINVLEVERRQGDPDTLIADPTEIKKGLNFEPKYSDLKTIIETAFKWHSNEIK